MTCLLNTRFGTANEVFVGAGRIRDLGEIFILRDYFTQGGLWGWGRNRVSTLGFGALGDNTTIDASSPVQTISGGTNWKTVSGAGTSSRVAAIKTDGTLWLWGTGTNGQLGTNTAVSASSPVQTISGGTDWKTISLGPVHTTTIKTNGTLWTWGRSTGGRLGDGTTIDKSSPVQTISGGTDWRCAVAGFYNSAGIKTDGTLWTWGYNCNGSLGNNSTIHVSSPVQIIGSATTWRHVSAALNFMAAIKIDGTLWTWGYNNNGRLGNNSIIAASSPVQVIGGATNWKQICTNFLNTAAIKTDGTLWLWGCASYGVLGNNNTSINRSSPVQTASGGTNWRNVAVGRGSALATKTNGTLWTWGRNDCGQLGTNTTISRSSPVQTVAGGTNWRSVSSGGYAAWGIKQY